MKSVFKKVVFASLTITMIGFSSCGLDQYNNSDPKKLKDHNEGNEYVYGVKGDSARQLRNDYPKPADADARAKAIRDKMFGDSNGSNLQETGNAATVVDSTKKEMKDAKNANDVKDAKKEETKKEESKKM
jgi:hypothetical protein